MSDFEGLASLGVDLCRTAARAAAAGLSPGRSGNISARAGGLLVMSPTNSDLADLDPDDLSVVSVDGEHIQGPPPSKEVPLHLALYTRDPAARAVVHVHSPFAVALSCRAPWAAHCAIPPITPYFLLKVGQVPLIDYFAPGDHRQAEMVATSPLAFSAVLLANHGQAAAGPDLGSALNAVIEVEEAARSVLLQPDGSYRLLTESQILELTTRGQTPWRDLR